MNILDCFEILDLIILYGRFIKLEHLKPIINIELVTTKFVKMQICFINFSYG